MRRLTPLSNWKFFNRKRKKLVILSLIIRRNKTLHTDRCHHVETFLEILHGKYPIFSIISNHSVDERDSLPFQVPPCPACNCKGDTLIDYKLFSVADLDITSPLPDYIDMCFYYLLICASRNNSFLLFYSKQHCKVSVLNHNYLPMQFMHLCPWGIW